MKAHVFALTSAVLLLAGLTSGEAMAVLSTYRHWGINGALGCQPTIPTTTVRYSAFGIRNAGAASIYVICGMAGDRVGSQDGGATTVYIDFRNYGTTSATVNCTLNSGLPATSNVFTNGSFPQSRTIAGGISQGFVYYSPSGKYFGNTNFTCLLPPRVEIRHMQRVYREQVGA